MRLKIQYYYLYIGISLVLVMIIASVIRSMNKDNVTAVSAQTPSLAPKMITNLIDILDETVPMSSFSLESSSRGALYLAYLKENRLHLSNYMAGIWHAVEVPESVIVGPSFSMSVGKDSSVHLFSFEEKNGKLKHDAFLNGKWITEYINVASPVSDIYTNIDSQINSHGNLSLCYIDSYPNVLVLLSKQDGSSTWKRQELKTDLGRLYNCVDIELDRNEDPIITFATKDSIYLGSLHGAWSYSRVTKLASINGGWPVMELDVADNPVVAYITDTPYFELMLAKRTNGRWLYSRVNSSDESVYSSYTLAHSISGSITVCYVGHINNSYNTHLLLTDIDDTSQLSSCIFSIDARQSCLILREPSVVVDTEGAFHVLFGYIPDESDGRLELREAVLGGR